MSEEDQIRAIGRLALDRSAVKREQALTRASLESIAGALETIMLACQNPDDHPNLSGALAAMDGIEKDGGLDGIRALMREFSKVAAKLRVLDERAREAGID